MWKVMNVKQICRQVQSWFRQEEGMLLLDVQLCLLFLTILGGIFYQSYLTGLKTGASLEQTRKRQDSLSGLGARAVRDTVMFKDLPMPRFDLSWAIPIGGRVRQAIVYLHGGGWVLGSIDPEHVITPGLFVQRLVQVPRTATGPAGFKAA